MTRRWRSSALALTCASSLFACVPPYRPPTASEPHAVLKVRRSYDATTGVSLRERLLIDEYVGLDNQRPSRLAQQPATDALLVHPAPATFVVKSDFFHVESHNVQEAYYDQEPYSTTESYSCGTGTSYRTCTRSATRYRSVRRTRWVTRTVEVSDGSCERTLRLAPAANRTYLLQYTYQDRGACALSCFEQRPSATEDFEQVRCPAAPSVKE